LRRRSFAESGGRVGRRLFRQSRAGNWRSAIDEVKQELAEFARSFRRNVETPRETLLAA
jgi:hypothetical protein